MSPEEIEKLQRRAMELEGWIHERTLSSGIEVWRSPPPKRRIYYGGPTYDLNKMHELEMGLFEDQYDEWEDKVKELLIHSRNSGESIRPTSAPAEVRLQAWVAVMEDLC